MSISLGKKIKLIRDAEGMSRTQFLDATGIPPDTLKGWELEKSKSVASDKLELITKSAVFKKYTLWLLTDESAPEVGQIAPSEESSKVVGAAIPEKILTSAFEQTMHTSISLGWLTPKDGINFEMLSDVFLADFEKVGGQTLKAAPLEPEPQVSSSKT